MSMPDYEDIDLSKCIRNCDSDDEEFDEDTEYYYYYDEDDEDKPK